MSDQDLKELDDTIAEEQEIVEASAEKEVDGEAAADEVASTVKKSAPKQAPVPKTKSGMINAMLDAVKGKKKDDLAASYESIMAAMKVEGFESAEEVAEETQSIKEIRQISSEDVSVAEDVEAMFSGEELSEEFTSKATTIFEAAVVSKVNEILETVTVDFESELEAEKVQIAEKLSEQVDSYLEYVAEEWMKENELAVEQGIRAEIVENFMTGLRGLFEENYIDIPEEKVDLVDELASKVTELESSINEEMERNIELRKELVESKQSAILSSACEGITESQAAKLQSLAEGVEFEDADSYTAKLETLKESYFPKEEVVSEEVVIDEDEPLELTEEATAVDPSMNAYLNAISKSIKK
jgi:Mg2+ and Co2+ transporter CorA